MHYGKLKFVEERSGALSIRPKIPEILGLGANGTDIFRSFIPKFLGVPREVGLKFQNIGIIGKFRSIRPFLLAPSFSEPGNRTQHGCQFFCSISVFRLTCYYATDDLNVLLHHFCTGATANFRK